MGALDIKYIFQDAFDTFKVFEIIPFEISGVLIEGHSKTIWQTLNHLIRWRDFQIRKLKSIGREIEFHESESWIVQSEPNSIDQWKAQLNEFKIQTEQIKELIASLDTSDSQLDEKLKNIQESSVHLSFHLGEIILIARQKNAYPKPHEMAEFLKG